MISPQMRAARWPLSESERFWSKVDKNGPAVSAALGPCWLWTGAKTKARAGYGVFKTDGRKITAHRWSWERRHGRVPDGQRLLHRCDVSMCVNDSHLFTGTQLENIADRVAKGRTNSKLTREQVAVIKREMRDESPTAIALRFGVSRATVCDLLAGRTWRHVA